MPEMIRYYRPNRIEEVGDSLLISGQCPTVKSAYLSQKLKKAASSGHIAILLDYGRTGDYSGIFKHNGYGSQHVFISGQNNYSPIRVSLHTEISNLRTQAQRQGYSYSEAAKMTAFLCFLTTLETEHDRSKSVKSLLRKFCNQDKLEKILVNLVRSHSISRNEAAAHIQTYLEYAKSGITADVLLSEMEFLTTPCLGNNQFALSDIRPGEAAIIYASENNSVDINDYMTRLWTADIIHLSENYPIFLILNTSYQSQIGRTYELIETLSHKSNVSLFYSTYDLFCGADEGQARAFAKMFEYNLYGTHSGDSARVISGMFGEHWITQYTYTDTSNKRIMGENILDRLFKTDYSKSVAATPFKDSIFPAENIVSMTPYEYIIFDTIRNTVQTASI